MAKIRRRAYAPKNEEQRDAKYGRHVGAQSDTQRAYSEKKAKKGKR